MSYVVNDTDLPNLIELKNIGQSYDGGNSYIIQNFDLLIEDKPAQGQFVEMCIRDRCITGCILNNGKNTIPIGKIL